MIVDLRVPLACVTLVVALNLGILTTVFTRLDQSLSYSGKTYCMFLISSVAHTVLIFLAYVGDDYPTWYGLDIGTVEMTFEETVHYPLSGAQAETEWNTLRRMDSHHGYIRLGPDKRVLAVAMFHELHCVNTLRKALVDRTHTEGSDHHVQHCLNYLRQLFLCSADSTLEPYDFTNRDFENERLGVTRQCRDWSIVYEETQRNYVEWLEWLRNNRTMVRTFPFLADIYICFITKRLVKAAQVSIENRTKGRKLQ